MAFMMDGREIPDGDAGRLMVLAGRLGMEDVGMILSMTGQSGIENPIVTFKKRMEAGDFDEVTEEEAEADGLRPGREPLTDEEFADRKEDVLATGGYWHKSASMPVLKLLWEITDGFARDRVLRLAELASYDARGMVYPVRNGQCVADMDELYMLSAEHEAAMAAVAQARTALESAAGACSDFDEDGCVICCEDAYAYCGAPECPEEAQFGPAYEVVACDAEAREASGEGAEGDADMSGIPEAGPCEEPGEGGHVDGEEADAGEAGPAGEEEG